MSQAPRPETVTLAGEDGSLEGLLEVPPAHASGRVAVVCHPHPQHGGTMQNKVVHTLCRAANDLGYAALRFNFRGVGASEGNYDHGVGERDDARAAIRWAEQRFGGPLLLAGFSFGAVVAIEVARTHPPAQLISIAPPVDRIDRDGWLQPDCPWLVVQGDNDELVAADAVVDFVNELEPGPRLLVLPDVDHFFHGQLVALRRALVDELGAV